MIRLTATDCPANISLLPKKPQRSSAYLAWIRALPCACCGRKPSEAAHTGPHGLGQKASDFTCIPLCTAHHTAGNDSYHRLGEKPFARLWRLDIEALTVRLRTAFEISRKSA